MLSCMLYFTQRSVFKLPACFCRFKEAGTVLVLPYDKHWCCWTLVISDSRTKSNPTDVDTVRGNGEVMCCVPTKGILSRSIYVPLDIKV